MGTERLRITPTRLHTEAYISVLVGAIVDVRRTLGPQFVEPPAEAQPAVDGNSRCTFRDMRLAAE